LIRPVRSALPGRTGALLTIVPHGPLTGLSFAPLMDDRGRYLLEDYALHYVPAAGVLQFTAGKRQPSARAGRIMLVADPTLVPRSRLDQPLPRLPGARTEVRAISSFVRRNQVTLLEGGAATESAVRLDAPERSVLHFATHAIVRDDDPFGSFLALRPSASVAAEDGYLTAREIYGLNLRSDLVVLSACRSGGGHVTGDGVATFARAFLSVGTPSVITSLWDVADQPTNRMLPDFYRAWLGGQSKARALRAAALKLLSDLRAGRVEVLTPAGAVRIPEHPVFWAGFALIGEPD
jgi:CHAT domain-containing protein